jgi:hypothetical protein
MLLVDPSEGKEAVVRADRPRTFSSIVRLIGLTKRIALLLGRQGAEQNVERLSVLILLPGELDNGSPPGG